MGVTQWRPFVLWRCCAFPSSSAIFHTPTEGERTESPSDAYAVLRKFKAFEAGMNSYLWNVNVRGYLMLCVCEKCSAFPDCDDFRILAAKLMLSVRSKIGTEVEKSSAWFACVALNCRFDSSVNSLMRVHCHRHSLCRCSVSHFRFGNAIITGEIINIVTFGVFRMVYCFSFCKQLLRIRLDIHFWAGNVLNRSIRSKR